MYGKGDVDELGSLHEYEGWTLYGGSAESDRMLRAYDGEPLHGFKGTRIESVFKNAAARALGKAITELPKGTDLSKWLIGITIGWFDFKEADPGVRASRRDRLPWWQKFHDFLEAEAIKVSEPIAGTTIEQKVNWLIGYVSRTLAMANKVIPGFAKELLAIGTDKLNAVDLKQIELWRKMSYG